MLLAISLTKVPHFYTTPVNAQIGYTQAMVRINPEQIKKLQKLLKEQTGKDYTEDEAQQAGLNIMRFVVAKEQRR